MTVRTGRRGRVPAAVTVSAAMALLVAACGGPTPVVSNGSVSVCYRALPVGRQALHAPGAKLMGVHRIPLDSVRAHLPAGARAELAAENDTAVCAMAFRGTFAAGQVQGADPAQDGDYALVLVSSRRLHLVGAIVLKHLPRAFGGRTF